MSRLRLRSGLLVASLACAMAFAQTGASAQTGQSPLRSPHLSLYPETNFYDFKVSNLGGDAAPDLLFSTILDGILAVEGDGVGGIQPATSVAGEAIVSLDTGDLDGDGRDDCAYLPVSGALVRIRLHAGGTWVNGPTLATYVKPTTVAITDLDLDGRLDVLAAENGLERLQWFRNLGGAQFAEPVDIECSEDARALAIGDVDADGWPDIASASSVLGAASVVITRSDGAGGFQLSETLATDIELNPGDTLLIADVDGDGVGDVLQAAQTEGVAIFYGVPGQQPRPPIYTDTVLPAQSLGAGDLDGDGDTDYSAGQHGGLVTNFMVEGAGAFTSRQFAAAVGPVFEHVTDFDLDGHLDVITGNGQVLTPLFGRGLGDFRPCYGFATQPLDIAVVDRDGDGFDDVVVARLGGECGLLPGVPGAGLGREQPVDLGPAPQRVFFTHADVDADFDLVALQAFSSMGIALGNGQGGFEPPIAYDIAPQITGGIVGDLNLDHLGDVIVLRDGGGSREAVVFMASASGAYALTQKLPLTATPVDADVADMDEDGLPDLVVLEGGVLVVFPGDGTGHFATQQQHATPVPAALDLIVRDFDADGHVDAAVAQAASAKTEVLVGKGDGTFDPELSFSVEVRVKPTGLDAADFDLDGGLDLFVTGLVDVTLPGSVVVLPSQHGGGFEDATFAASSSDAGKPVAADLDADGRADAALLIPKGNQLDLYVNAASTWIPLGHSLSGSAGYSKLVGTGPLSAGSTVSLQVDGAAPLAPAALFAGFFVKNLPFKGGVLVPDPILIVPGLTLSAEGGLLLAGAWPSGVPSSLPIVLQAWMQDAGGPAGFSASTAVQGVTP